jgi:hypothetical protein
MRPSRLAGWSGIVFSIAAALALAMEAIGTAVGGFEADDASGTLRFVTDHPQFWAVAAPAYLLMGLALIPMSIGTSEVLARAGAHSVPIRSVQVLGILSGAMFVITGVLRATGGPLQYMAELDPAAGIAATATVIVLTTHGGIQGGVLMLCIWSVAVSILALRRRALPVWLCVLGLVPGVRVALLVVGPLGAAADALWVVAVAVIPWVLLWPGVLGAVMVLRARDDSAQVEDGAGGSVVL